MQLGRKRIRTRAQELGDAPLPDKTPDMQLVRWQTDQAGVRVAVVGPDARKWTKLVMFGFPISLKKVRREERRAMTELEDYRGGVKRAARLMVERGKTAGITKEAKAFLKEAA